MSELLKWKIPIRVWGLQVSLHLFYWLFAGYVALASVMIPTVEGVWNLGCALLGLVVLTLAVLAHELGHLLVARRLRGDCDELLIWPLGGLAPASLSPWGMEQRAAGSDQVAVALAGPAVNLVICLILLPVALLLDAPVLTWLNPLSVPSAVDTPAVYYPLAMAFWINAVLVIANLLPGYPLDGARVLRGVLRNHLDADEATRWTYRGSLVVAVMLVVVGLIVDDLLIRLPVVALGVFVFFAGRAELETIRPPKESDTFLGYDFSAGYTSLERHHEAEPAPPTPAPLPWSAGSNVVGRSASNGNAKSRPMKNAASMSCWPGFTPRAVATASPKTNAG